MQQNGMSSRELEWAHQCLIDYLFTDRASHDRLADSISGLKGSVSPGT
jgi:hypothetical protein